MLRVDIKFALRHGLTTDWEIQIYRYAGWHTPSGIDIAATQGVIRQTFVSARQAAAVNRTSVDEFQRRFTRITTMRR